MWTDKQVKGFPVKDSRYRVTDDLGQKGAGKLLLDIQPNGIKNFYFQYYIKSAGSSKRELIRIGRYRDSAKISGLSLSEAREKALEFSRLAAENHDLKAYLIEQEELQEASQRQRESANISLQVALDSYLANRDLKPNTIIDYRRAIRETFKEELSKPLASISREKILSIYRHRSAKSPARANNAMRVFKAIYNFQRAVSRSDDGQYLLPENPASILQETKVIKKLKRRQGYIPREDLKHWFEAVNSLADTKYTSGAVVRDYMIFLLLTGVRREEGRQLRREDVNLKRGVFHLTDTKNREVVELPLSTPLIKILRARLASLNHNYVFSTGYDDKPIGSFKRPIQFLREEHGLNFTLHDLRRTFITVAESLDISGYTIKRLVNHKLNSSVDVTAGYMVIDIERMRVATEKISATILKLNEACSIL